MYGLPACVHAVLPVSVPAVIVVCAIACELLKQKEAIAINNRLRGFLALIGMVLAEIKQSIYL